MIGGREEARPVCGFPLARRGLTEVRGNPFDLFVRAAKGHLIFGHT
jgi:hypothetical protein